MGWTSTSPSVSILGLILALLLITKAFAQGACDGPTNIDIAFPELDPPSTPNPNDPLYSQIILTSGIEPSDLVIKEDTARPSNYPFSEYFEHRFNSFANPPGYYVYMIKGIDRDGTEAVVEDDVNILQYLVDCEPSPGSTRQFMTLKIQIRDVNDNAPVFQQAPYAFTVNELTPVGLTVFRRILAIDLDEGPNKQIRYTLSNNLGAQFPGADYFAIPSASEGLVSVIRDLDFESMYRATNFNADLAYYNITVIATDQGTPPLSSTTSLVIKITDGDDLGPEFVYPSCIPSTEQFGKSCIRPKYMSSLPSGTTSNTPLVFSPNPSDANNPTVDIIMQDRDTLNYPVQCVVPKTEPPGYEGYFQASTVRVGSTKQYICSLTYVPAGQPAILRGDVSSLELIVEAVEQQGQRRVDYATVVLSVTQTNLYPPRITASSTIGYINENVPAGSLVYGDRTLTGLLQLTFSDPDVSPLDPQPTFDISTSAGAPFAVNPSGTVYLAVPPLDYELRNTYLLAVTITEQTPERRSASIDLIINVLDLSGNDC